MIIGITGTDGSGKGTVVDYLVEHEGFVLYHARKLFIEEIEKQGLENNRANMRIVANQIRKEYGNDAIIIQFLKQANERGDKKIVIDSIRALAEAETLKRLGGILLAVDANQHLRFERIQSRQSSSDQVTFEEFLEHEQLEMNDPDPNGMQKAKVMKIADHTIMNGGSLEELHRKIEEFLGMVR